MKYPREAGILMKTHRLARVAEAVREVASQTILFELRDPRVKNVTVTRAEVSGDLQHAKVYVSVMGTPKEAELCLYGLRHAAGFVQSKLASRLKTRYTPQIHFVLDEGVKKSIEVSRLINEALGRPTAVEAAAGAGDVEEPEEETAGDADGTAEGDESAAPQ